MLRHSNFSMRANFKLQPFITVFAVYCSPALKSLPIAVPSEAKDSKRAGLVCLPECLLFVC